MNKAWLRTAILALVLGIMAITAYYRPYPNTCCAKSLTATKDISVTLGEGMLLVFDGSTNQSRTGDIEFIVNAPSNCAIVRFEITGTAFSNGTDSLDTEYQLVGETTWHKSGNPFVVETKPGKHGKIRFRATTGDDVTSQPAGTYKAKLRVHIVSASINK